MYYKLALALAKGKLAVLILTLFCSKLTQKVWEWEPSQPLQPYPCCNAAAAFAAEQDAALCLSMCRILSCLDSHGVHVYNNDFMLAIDIGFVSECPHIWVILSSGLRSAVLTFTAWNKQLESLEEYLGREEIWHWNLKGQKMSTFIYDERKCARAAFRNLGSSEGCGQCLQEDVRKKFRD